MKHLNWTFLRPSRFSARRIAPVTACGNLSLAVAVCLTFPGCGGTDDPGATGAGDNTADASTGEDASESGDASGDGPAGECGDGILDESLGEECDLGVENDNEGYCTQACLLAACGDGFPQPGEECDDGNTNNNDSTCTTECTVPACGDSYVQAPEECDDANDVETDDCLSTCVAARCGDGVVQEGVEECDDANAENDDGCLNDCTLLFSTTCDNGVVDPGEFCHTIEQVVISGFGPEADPIDVAVGDFSGNGYLDIAFITGSTIGWMTNNQGSGQFEVLPNGYPFAWGMPAGLDGGRALEVADIDGDGFDDIVGLLRDETPCAPFASFPVDLSDPADPKPYPNTTECKAQYSGTPFSGPHAQDCYDAIDGGFLLVPGSATGPAWSFDIDNHLHRSMAWNERALHAVDYDGTGNVELFASAEMMCFTSGIANVAGLVAFELNDPPPDSMDNVGPVCVSENTFNSDIFDNYPLFITDAMASGDFNNDSFQDLVLLSRDEATFLVHSIDETDPGTCDFPKDIDTLRYERTFMNLEFPHNMAVGDIDGNGVDDLVFSRWNEVGCPYDTQDPDDCVADRVTVMTGSERQTSWEGFEFDLEVAALVGKGPSDVGVGDFNADGIDDVVTANAVSEDLSIVMGQIPFVGNVVRTMNLNAGQTNTSLAVGDFNEDGVADIVTAHRETRLLQIILSSP